MFDTYRMMNQYNTVEFNDISMNDIVKIFRGSLDRNEKSRLYANLFCRLFPMMVKQQQTFPMLSNTEKAEICMCVLLDAIKHYKNEKIKFSTYFCTCLKNRFITHRQQLGSLKNRTWANTVLENDQVKYIINIATDKSIGAKTRKFLRELKDTNELTNVEKEYCACIIAGYKTQADIASKLNLASRVEKLHVTDPNHDKRNMELCKKIRIRLKQKLKQTLPKIIH